MGQETVECSKCKGQFHNNEILYEEVPDNMSFEVLGPLGPERKIPKCPLCNELHFFGFKTIDIAF
jgi:NAD-dependent SIR2 family protein deacetylase